jgi:hypothetical protein
VFGFEYAILMTIVANTVVKYVLHSVDLYSEAPWENKAVFMLYTELFIGLIKVFLVTSLKQGLRTLLRIRIRDPVLFDPGSGHTAWTSTAKRPGRTRPSSCSTQSSSLGSSRYF